VSSVVNSDEYASNEKKALDLLEKVEDMYRSSSSYAELSMLIETPHWKRTLTMEAWSKGEENSFIRILSPRKDAGITTLKLENEMWNYFPKINKTIKVPPSMMMGSWMGSDFTNDDLVREHRLTEEYDLKLIETDNHYQIILIPKEETATVWAKIDMLINKKNLLPFKQTYYDEADKPIRVMEYQDIKDFGGHLLPATMVMTPLNKSDHKTIVTYEKLDLDITVDDSQFSLRELKKRRY